MDELARAGHLYQEVAAAEMKRRFGSEFVHINPNGNLSIDRQVLKEFRTITGDGVVWERGERCWRRRASYDSPGRRAD